MTQYCEDHNECMFDTHDCDQEAHCNNTDGSYFCFGFFTEIFDSIDVAPKFSTKLFYPKK